LFRKAVQCGGVGDVQCAGLRCRKQLLGEGRSKRAEALIDCFELHLLCGRQFRARMHELFVIIIEQLRLLGVEV